MRVAARVLVYPIQVGMTRRVGWFSWFSLKRESCINWQTAPAPSGARGCFVVQRPQQPQAERRGPRPSRGDQLHWTDNKSGRQGLAARRRAWDDQFRHDYHAASRRATTRCMVVLGSWRPGAPRAGDAFSCLESHHAATHAFASVVRRLPPSFNRKHPPGPLNRPAHSSGSWVHHRAGGHPLLRPGETGQDHVSDVADEASRHGLGDLRPQVRAAVRPVCKP